jgi:hypothetical protein
VFVCVDGRGEEKGTRTCTDTLAPPQDDNAEMQSAKALLMELVSSNVDKENNNHHWRRGRERGKAAQKRQGRGAGGGGRGELGGLLQALKSSKQRSPASPLHMSVMLIHSPVCTRSWRWRATQTEVVR